MPDTAETRPSPRSASTTRAMSGKASSGSRASRDPAAVPVGIADHDVRGVTDRSALPPSPGARQLDPSVPPREQASQLDEPAPSGLSSRGIAVGTVASRRWPASSSASLGTSHPRSSLSLTTLRRRCRSYSCARRSCSHWSYSSTSAGRTRCSRTRAPVPRAAPPTRCAGAGTSSRTGTPPSAPPFGRRRRC